MISLRKLRFLRMLPVLRGARLQQNGERLMCMCSEGPDKRETLRTPEDIAEPPLPPYRERTGESLAVRKARLLYQSRKRGMLENDLLLSSFAARYLDNMTEEQLHMYDTIINKPNNDWDIYHWLTGKKEVPEEYNNEVLHMMIEHCKNKDMEDRTRMPNLHQK